MPRVAINTNVLISTVLDRDVEQQQKTEQLLLRAENGELVIALPQFVIFEAIYVLRSFYEFPPHEITTMLREAISLPRDNRRRLSLAFVFRVLVESPSRRRRRRHHRLAIANRYELATFDRKLANRAKTFGVASYG